MYGCLHGLVPNSDVGIIFGIASLVRIELRLIREVKRFRGLYGLFAIKPLWIKIRIVWKEFVNKEGDYIFSCRCLRLSNSIVLLLASIQLTLIGQQVHNCVLQFDQQPTFKNAMQMKSMLPYKNPHRYLFHSSAYKSNIHIIHAAKFLCFTNISFIREQSYLYFCDKQVWKHLQVIRFAENYLNIVCVLCSLVHMLYWENHNQFMYYIHISETSAMYLASDKKA